MKIIFDFDDVLFKTSELKIHIFAVLGKYGVSNGALLYEDERKTELPFSLKRFLYKVSKQHPEIKMEIDNVYEEIMENCQNLVNKEAVILMQQLGKENCFIVTNGDQEFQKDKIVRTSLDKLAQRIKIVSGSKKEEIESLCEEFMNEQVIFVDDKSKFFKDIKEMDNLTTVEYVGDNAFSVLIKQVEMFMKKEQQKLALDHLKTENIKSPTSEVAKKMF